MAIGAVGFDVLIVDDEGILYVGNDGDDDDDNDVKVVLDDADVGEYV